jgi:hypothetical protein
MYSENDTASAALSPNDDLFMKEFKIYRQFKDSDVLENTDSQLILTHQLNQGKQTLQKYNLKV